MTPNTIAGIPSTMNSHRQPCKPSQCTPSSQPPRGTDNVGDGDGYHEHRARFRSVFGSEPVREVHENAGEESGFGHAQQDSNEVEMHGRPDERHQDGDESPGDHDACEPFAGAPALHDEAAGNFEEQVADKKYSRAEAKNAVTEAQIVRHFEGGVADVHAIEKRNHKKCEEERQETPRDAAACAWANLTCGRRQIHAAQAHNTLLNRANSLAAGRNEIGSILRRGGRMKKFRLLLLLFAAASLANAREWKTE